MNVNMSGLGMNLTVSVQWGAAKSGQTGFPVFDNNRVWSSLDEFGAAGVKYGEEWVKVYSDRFSGLENGGRISMEELDEQLRAEFGSFGVRWVDNDPKDVRAGQNDIYIDEANRRKMANDPEYRARVFGIIQRELSVAPQGFRYQHGGQTIQAPCLAGGTMSFCEGNKVYNGVPYLGMGIAGPTFAMGQSGSPTNPVGLDKSAMKKGKSFFDIIRELMEDLQKRMAERLDKVEIGTTKGTKTAGLDVTV